MGNSYSDQNQQFQNQNQQFPSGYNQQFYTSEPPSTLNFSPGIQTANFINTQVRQQQTYQSKENLQIKQQNQNYYQQNIIYQQNEKNSDSQSFLDFLCCHCHSVQKENEFVHIQEFLPKSDYSFKTNLSYQNQIQQELQAKQIQQDQYQQVSNTYQKPIHQNKVQTNYISQPTTLKPALKNETQELQTSETPSDIQILKNSESKQELQAKNEQITPEIQDKILNNLFAGEQEKVKQLIFLLGIDVNMDIGVKPAKTTLLHIGCHRGFTYLVQYLLEKGAKINVQDEKGQTPLMFATIANQIDCLYLLLQVGADIQIKNDQNLDAIQLAENNNSHHIAILLRKYKKKKKTIA